MKKRLIALITAAAFISCAASGCGNKTVAPETGSESSSEVSAGNDDTQAAQDTGENTEAQSGQNTEAQSDQNTEKEDPDAEAMVESQTPEKEPEEVSETEQVSTVVVGNKTWKAYTEDGRGADDGEHVKISKISEYKTEWLNTEAWADEHGFAVATLPHVDDAYYYEGTMTRNYYYMYNGLNIYDKNDNKLIYSLDLGTLCNGPDEAEGKYSGETQFIRWAKIYDGTLYLAVIINAYSEAEPESNYMVAVDPATGDVLWRSQPLVDNANNFQIIKDTIICGYGFTAEPDYIYLLDRFTGQEIQKIKVNSAPDQFEIVGDTLYVATYNTAYEFQIESE